MDYGALPVFRELTNDQVEEMIRCFGMRRICFQTGETVCVYGGGQEIGVVLSGTVELARFDADGLRTILERLGPGGVFGEMLAFTAGNGDCVEAVCDSACQVLFMPYDRLMGRCEKACRHHSQLVQNMFALVTEQTRCLSRRVEVLSQRSIREKLVCFFRGLALEEGTDTVTLPFTISTLADYVGADRSAMTREMGRMRDEGLLLAKGRRYTLLRQGREQA